MNMTKWVSDMIAAPQKKAMPVLSFPAIQKMGITVAELVKDPDLQAKGMKLIADTVDSAAVVSYMDLSVEAEAFGSKIHVDDNEVPTVVGSIIKTEEDADALTVPEIGAARTGLNIEAIRKVSEIITDKPIFAGVIGPFSLAGRLVGVSEAMICCFEEPEMMEKVLKKVTSFLIGYIKAFKNAGANGVVMAEPLAGLLSPDLAGEFSEIYVKEIVDAVQEEDFIIVYHNCGNSAIQTMDTIKNNGCKAFHLGNAIDMADALPLIDSDKLVMGNIDPAGQFRNGTPESIYEKTQETMKRCCQYDNFVVSSGCDIPPMSPWENIESFFKAVRDYYCA